MPKLDGQVALVTGAAQGMGKAHARLLAENGAIVIVCDVNDDEGRSTANDIGGTFCHLDVSDEGDWERVTEEVSSEIGLVTILVNNAGVVGVGPVHETTTQLWDRMISVNLTGAFFGIRAMVPLMRSAGGGVIVNVSSDAGLTGMSQIAAYSTSKWGVRGLTRASALDLSRFNIRVVSLHPGTVRTPMSAGADLEAMTKHRPIARPGEADELAKMMLFLVTEATYSTGCEFIADGGYTAGVPLPS